mgnify:CR=1 FL=1
MIAVAPLIFLQRNKIFFTETKTHLQSEFSFTNHPRHIAEFLRICDCSFCQVSILIEITNVVYD